MGRIKMWPQVGRPRRARSPTTRLRGMLRCGGLMQRRGRWRRVGRLTSMWRWRCGRCCLRRGRRMMHRGVCHLGGSWWVRAQAGPQVGRPGHMCHEAPGAFGRWIMWRRWGDKARWRMRRWTEDHAPWGRCCRRRGWCEFHGGVSHLGRDWWRRVQAGPQVGRPGHVRHEAPGAFGHWSRWCRITRLEAQAS